MAPVNQWRPTWRQGEASDMVQLSFRKIFDFIYSQTNDQGPLAASATVPQNAPLVTVPDVATQPYGSGMNLIITLPRAGTWVISATVALTITGDANQQFQALLMNSGFPLAKRGIGQLAADGTLMISQSWTVSAGTVGTNRVAPTNGLQYYVQVVKAAGGGTSKADPNHSSLTAVWSGT